MVAISSTGLYISGNREIDIMMIFAFIRCLKWTERGTGTASLGQLFGEMVSAQREHTTGFNGEVSSS